jgi:hypothetical protein
VKRKRLVSVVSIVLNSDSWSHQEKEVIDPLTLKPQLYAAASINNTAQVLEYIELNVPVTHLDQRSGFTVSVCLCNGPLGNHVYSLCALKALHWAALNGNVILVKKLLEWYAIVDQLNFWFLLFTLTV